MHNAASINKTIVTLLTQPDPFDVPQRNVVGWLGKTTTHGNAADLCSIKTKMRDDIGEIYERSEWADPVTPPALLTELHTKLEELCKLLQDKDVKCEPIY